MQFPLAPVEVQLIGVGGGGQYCTIGYSNFELSKKTNMCHIIFYYKYISKNIVEKAFSYIFIGFIPTVGATPLARRRRKMRFLESI